MTRKSKREIEQRIEELGGDVDKEQYPVLDDLCLMIQYDWEEIDGHDGLIRRKDDGKIYRQVENDTSLAEVIAENEERLD